MRKWVYSKCFCSPIHFSFYKSLWKASFHVCFSFLRVIHITTLLFTFKVWLKRYKWKSLCWVYNILVIKKEEAVFPIIPNSFICFIFNRSNIKSIVSLKRLTEKFNKTKPSNRINSRLKLLFIFLWSPKLCVFKI